MSENKIIITVSGTDKVGIVAKVATILAECSVNIEDIKQTLMQGHFVSRGLHHRQRHALSLQMRKSNV